MEGRTESCWACSGTACKSRRRRSLAEVGRRQLRFAYANATQERARAGRGGRGCHLRAGAARSKGRPSPFAPALSLGSLTRLHMPRKNFPGSLETLLHPCHPLLRLNCPAQPRSQQFPPVSSQPWGRAVPTTLPRGLGDQTLEFSRLWRSNLPRVLLGDLWESLPASGLPYFQKHRLVLIFHFKQPNSSQVQFLKKALVRSGNSRPGAASPPSVVKPWENFGGPPT